MKLEEVSPQKIMLVRNEEQLAYGIPSHDWDYLKHLIDNICVAEPIHLTLELILGHRDYGVFWRIIIAQGCYHYGLSGQALVMDDFWCLFPKWYTLWYICIYAA